MNKIDFQGFCALRRINENLLSLYFLAWKSSETEQLMTLKKYGKVQEGFVLVITAGQRDSCRKKGSRLSLPRGIIWQCCFIVSMWPLLIWCICKRKDNSLLLCSRWRVKARSLCPFSKLLVFISSFGCQPPALPGSAPSSSVYLSSAYGFSCWLMGSISWWHIAAPVES